MNDPRGEVQDHPPPHVQITPSLSRSPLEILAEQLRDWDDSDVEDMHIDDQDVQIDEWDEWDRSHVKDPDNVKHNTGK